VSIGVAAVDPGDTTISPALRRADDALYAAKSAGRNRHAVGGTVPEEKAPSSERARPPGLVA
jgi:predicted signal transduction protein with EAL and GGDEF domain